MDKRFYLMRELAKCKPELPKVYDFNKGLLSAPTNGWEPVKYSQKELIVGDYYYIGNSFVYVCDYSNNHYACVNNSGWISFSESMIENCFGHNFCHYTNPNQKNILWKSKDVEDTVTYTHVYGKYIMLTYDYELLIEQLSKQIDLKLAI